MSVLVRGGLAAMQGARRHRSGAPWAPTDLTGLRIWLREDVTDDGSGRANPWIDKAADLGNAANGTATARPTIGTDARLNSQPTLDFDGGDALLAGGTAGDWQRLHNGSDITLWGAFAPDTGATGNRVICSTLSALNSVSHGFYLRHDGTNTRLQIIIGNGSGTFLVNAAGGTGSVPLNAGYTWVYRADGSGWSLRVNGADYTSGSYTGSPSTTDPGAALWIGGLNGTGSWDGTMAELGRADSYVSGVDLTALESYLAVRY